jgi:polar amino acid transport system permease protein/octopine/nopaline transport system permease protein
LTGIARVIVARTFAPYELFIMAAIMYLVLTLFIVRTLKYAEWRLSPHLRPPPISDR